MPHSMPQTSVDLSETRQPNLYASSTIPLFIACLCVGLRFWSRWKNAAGLWLDDWLILGSLTFGPTATEKAFIGLFSCELTYTGIVVLVKSSILALYWRIFNRTNIKIPISILATAVCMWGIAVTSVGTGSTRPFGRPSKLTWQLSQVRAIVKIRMAHHIYCIKACLPTLRPVWVAVRRTIFDSQSSNQSEDPPGATPPIRTQGPSWATRILKSNSDDQEEIEPFSIVSHTEETPHNYSTVDSSCNDTTVGIPLSTVKKQAINEEEGITIKRAWDVEYNQYSHSNV
ncbi:uncharacterized protein N7483_006186 [Penicillium malachiteum]|uniref:uncharacterized protein n=1 Tax=Penicillium malachiteum TaxID=1324776 RepID=UPI0025494FFA|nr:uncharacterized protein N7483_006186 [Penicillium malachiteum]KAJ5731678.1 hypothetical protein N7483_006186 [Penicillium malachiteum]